MDTHVVKKYSNRKLYDTFSRRYITLDVIADLLREGHEVQVVDRTSGADITAVTLSQILVDLERQNRGPLSEPLLVDLVKERSEQFLSLLRGSLTLPRRAAESLEKGTQRVESRVDEAVTFGLRGLNIASHEELEALIEDVRALAKRVERLEATLAAPRPARRRSRRTPGGSE